LQTSRPKDPTNVHQLVELFITDIQENGEGCDIIPGYHYWVIKGNSKSKKKVPDECTFVDQLGMNGISEKDFINTYTATKYVTNLTKNHPRLRFETWSDLNLVTIIGERDPYMPGAPNDKDQIIRNKNARRNARSLARSRASASKPRNNSSGPSSDSTNDPSESTPSPPNESPVPEENTSASKIVPLREHLASCFKKLGIEAIASIVEDLVLLNSELYDKLDKLKKPSARSMCDAVVEKHNIAIHLPEDIEISVVEPPNPTDKGKKRPALLSFGIDVDDDNTRIFWASLT
jgi:hypothetical protein